MTTSYMQETLTQDTDAFEKILGEMETYYIETVKEESVTSLPRYISAYLVEYEGLQEKPSDFEQQLKKETGEKLNSWQTSREASLTKITKDILENRISDQEWDSKLKVMQKDDIEYATQIIEAAYAKIRERGNAHPEERSALIKIAKSVSEETKKIVDTMVNFISDLAKKIYKLEQKTTYENISDIFILLKNGIETYFF